MSQVTECINCGWKAEDGLSHDEYVKNAGIMAWLCYRIGATVYDIAEILPPRPRNADPVFGEDGTTVIGYTVRS